MKAALEAWGADSNLFHQGQAKESNDPDVIAATMKKPGVVLKRPVGSGGPFGEHAELPKNLGQGGTNNRATKRPSREVKKSSAQPDNAADRKAARAYEGERDCREREEAKEEAAQERERETPSASRHQGAGLFGRGGVKAQQPVTDTACPS
jgi:hypothetical protein